MGDLFSINPHTGSGWKSTFEAVLNVLRKPKFVVEETFDFKDYNPNVNWNGMTVTAVDIKGTRYCIIGKLLLLSFDVRGTLAAPLTNVVNIDLPEGRNSFFRDPASNGFPAPTHVTYANNAGVAEFGGAYALAGDNKLNLIRLGGINYTAGAFLSTASIFLELN